MTDTRTFPFPLTNAEDRKRLEAIRDAGEWRGWKIKEIVIGERNNDCLSADIIVYDHEKNRVANVVIQTIDMPGVTSMEQAMRLARHNRTCRLCGGMDRHAIGCPNGY